MPAAKPDDLAARIARLSAAQQRQAVAYVLKLEQVADASGLLAFAGAFAADDLVAMAAAIEADCERVDASQW